MKERNCYLSDLDGLEDDCAGVFVVVALLDLLFAVDDIPDENKQKHEIKTFLN